MFTLTVQWLVEHEACREQVELFCEVFPARSAAMTPENIAEAQTRGLPVYWLFWEYAQWSGRISLAHQLDTARDRANAVGNTAFSHIYRRYVDAQCRLLASWGAADPDTSPAEIEQAKSYDFSLRYDEEDADWDDED